MTVLLLALTLLQTPPPPSDQTVYAPGTGIVAPQPTRRVDPQYSPEAIRARKEGSVLVEGTVELNGAVTDIRVLRPLDAELDEAAIRAFREWRFRPGSKGGMPVRVRVSVEIVFSIRGRDSGSAFVVFRRTEPDGTQTSFEIGNERFQKLPRWDPAVTVEPPLSAADAIRAATTWLRTTTPNARDAVLSSVTLRRFYVLTSNTWCYQIEFLPPVRDPLAVVNSITAIVLFDGGIVEPKR